MSKTIEEYNERLPYHAVEVVWEPDTNFQWDGDGPDPIGDGLYPHEVTVSVSTIRKGKLITGEAYLGGCYSELSGPHCSDIHGYLPQLLQEAHDELLSQLA